MAYEKQFWEQGDPDASDEIDRLERKVKHWKDGYEVMKKHSEDQAVEINKLQAFKDYVHKRLDDAGIPVDPESPHKAAGCRIGGRLDYVITENQRLNTEVESLRKWRNNARALHERLEEEKATVDKPRQENERYKEALQCMMNVEHYGDFMNAFFDLKDQVKAALQGE